MKEKNVVRTNNSFKVEYSPKRENKQTPWKYVIHEDFKKDGIN